MRARLGKGMQSGTKCVHSGNQCRFRCKLEYDACEVRCKQLHVGISQQKPPLLTCTETTCVV